MAEVRPGLEELTLIACSTSAGAQKHLEMSGATFAPFRKLRELSILDHEGYVEAGSSQEPFRHLPATLESLVFTYFQPYNHSRAADAIFKRAAEGLQKRRPSMRVYLAVKAFDPETE
jgi:hypothetical protein